MATTWRLEHEEVVDEVEALGLLIRETDSGLIAFGVIGGVAEREAAVRALKERLALPFKELTLTSDQKDPVALLLSVPEDERACVSIYDLEGALPDAAGFLNHQRESFGEIPHAVVFWVVEDGLRRLATLAPDFWAWRSGVFDFRSNQYKHPLAGMEAAFADTSDFRDRGDLERKISLYQGLIDEYARQSEPDVRFLARLEVKLSWTFFHLGRFAEARAHADAALAQSLEARDGEVQADALDVIGAVAVQTDSLDEAETSFRKGLALREEAGVEKSVADTSHSLGLTALLRQRLDEAEGWFRMALQIYDRLGMEREVADEYFELGNVKLTATQFDEAEDGFRSALEIYERLATVPNEASAHHQLGAAAQERREPDEAEDRFRGALEVHDRFGLELNTARAYQQLGTVARELWRTDEAEEWYRKAKKKLELLGRSRDLVGLFLQMAVLRLLRGRWDEVASLLGRALAIATEHEMNVVSSVTKALAVLGASRGEHQFADAWRQAFDGQDPPPEVMDAIRAKAQTAPASDPEGLA